MPGTVKSKLFPDAVKKIQMCHAERRNFLVIVSWQRSLHNRLWTLYWKQGLTLLPAKDINLQPSLQLQTPNIGRLTIKSQALKWCFLNKIQKCILDIFETRLESFEHWKLHDKRSIMIDAQKRSIELDMLKLFWYIAGLIFLNDKWLVPVFWQHVKWQHYNVCLLLVSWRDRLQRLDPNDRRI